MKPTVSSILHASELVLKTRKKSVWAWNTICGIEVEGAMIPLARDIHHIIVLWILRRRLDVRRLQDGVNEFVSLRCHLRFQGIWNLRFLFGWAIYPHFFSFCHASSLFLLSTRVGLRFPHLHHSPDPYGTPTCSRCPFPSIIVRLGRDPSVGVGGAAEVGWGSLTDPGSRSTTTTGKMCSRGAFPLIRSRSAPSSHATNRVLKFALIGRSPFQI